MIKYEHVNTDSASSYSIYETFDLTWNTHFHQAFECITVIEGEIDCTVNANLYELKQGDSVLIMPNQPHSFKTKNSSKLQLIRFSPKLAGSFFSKFKNKIPTDNRFKIETHLPCQSTGLPQPENIFALKGLIYTILGEFFRQQKEWETAATEKAIIHKMIMYIEENFKNDCTLKEIADLLNYDYTYISREFLKFTGFTFVEYLNNCRINHACYLLENTDMSITKIAYECGYSTLRTFNRNFLKYTNTQPNKYSCK